MTRGLSAAALAAAAGWILLAEPLPAPRVRAAEPAVRELDTGAAGGSLVPSLAAGPNGSVLLSWVEPRGEKAHALRVATRAPGGDFSPARTVAAGGSWLVNWADFPQLEALADGTLFAHWLERRPQGRTYDYDIRLTRSRDLGRSWDEPVSPYADTSPGEHGFLAYAPLDAQRMGVLFLDGRETSRPGGATTLRFAAMPIQGTPPQDTLVDERVCDCCQTALARTSRGLVAAYRDRSEGELRDIAVARFADGRWSAPAVPAPDGWQISGCPVNGPALAAAGDTVALAWFTMAGQAPRVKLSFSKDAGASWGQPIVVDDGRPIGRVDVALAKGGDSALASWLEQTEAGASLRVRRVFQGGERGLSVAVAPTSGARSSGFPRLAMAPDGLVVAWRDAAEPSRVRAAVVAVP